MDQQRIETNIEDYLSERTGTARYSSFDYCYNHFASFAENDRLPSLLVGETLELSCLHLAFYLASWGMLRGSSSLLARSIRHYVPVIEAIVAAPSGIWHVDADTYDEAAIDLILNVSRQIRASFSDRSSDILITKVMLGVFGCIPAFDTRFKRGFGVRALASAALRRVADFYKDNREVIERHREFTLDFTSGSLTHRRYSRAKVIDMIFFIEGGRAA